MRRVHRGRSPRCRGSPCPAVDRCVRRCSMPSTRLAQRRRFEPRRRARTRILAVSVSLPTSHRRKRSHPSAVVVSSRSRCPPQARASTRKVRSSLSPRRCWPSIVRRRRSSSADRGLPEGQVAVSSTRASVRPRRAISSPSRASKTCKLDAGCAFATEATHRTKSALLKVRSPHRFPPLPRRCHRAAPSGTSTGRRRPEDARRRRGPFPRGRPR